MKKARPEVVGLDGSGLRGHSKSNQRQVRKGLLQGVAECVVKENKLVYTDIRGYQDVERRAKMTDRSLIRCYSITKPITAFALMALWEEGKVGLNDPVSKYIPEFARMRVSSKRHTPKRACRPITLRHLLQWRREAAEVEALVAAVAEKHPLGVARTAAHRGGPHA